jgi:hypothetical protein
MFWRLRLFGWEIASLERDDEEEPMPGITGGSSHNFDRDTEPLNPDDRYDWDIDKFGFR